MNMLEPLWSREIDGRSVEKYEIYLPEAQEPYRWWYAKGCYVIRGKASLGYIGTPLFCLYCQKNNCEHVETVKEAEKK